MKTLKELARDPSFANEVERRAQSLYADIRQRTFPSDDVPIAMCWIMAVDSLLVERGANVEVLEGPKNIVRLRGN
jgi:hypothetical protein